MPSLNSLVATPGSSQPPEQQGGSGSAPASSLQSLMQQGGQQQQGGGQMRPPSHQETTAVLDHIMAFHTRWMEMLKDPEVGTKNMRPAVMDMMADMISDDYASLPQVMGLLKTMPTEPLEQKQWIEQHVQNDMQGMAAVLDHHAQGRGPPGDFQTEMAQASEPGDRSQLVNGLIGRYKAHPKKPAKTHGVPIKGRHA